MEAERKVPHSQQPPTPQILQLAHGRWRHKNTEAVFSVWSVRSLYKTRIRWSLEEFSQENTGMELTSF
jgi:hypothetical protein